MSDTAIVTDADWPTLANIPEDDLVDMAAELSILVPAKIDRRTIIDKCIWAILERAGEEGLPFSKYDRFDLEDLPPAHLQALGATCGVSGEVTPDAMIKAGRKVYKRLQKSRKPSAVALLLPTLLPIVARTAAQLRQSGNRQRS